MQRDLVNRYLGSIGTGANVSQSYTVLIIVDVHTIFFNVNSHKSVQGRGLLPALKFLDLASVKLNEV